MRRTIIHKAKEKAKECIVSPICGNSLESPSVEKAIEYVQSLKFYPNEEKNIKFWGYVLKELNKIKKNF